MSEEGKERVWKEQCIRRGWERSMGQASTDPITIPARLEYTACRGPHYEDTSAHTPAARWARTKMENIAARLELRPRGGPEKSQPARERATVQFDAESAGWNVVEPPTAQQSSRFYQRSSAAYGTRLGSSSCRAAGRLGWVRSRLGLGLGIGGGSGSCCWQALPSISPVRSR
eukprot:TRINITY_DN2441_c0_g1_i3.p1 TRINITY_DN2441_c0_g1~~TRINITY_DN2441_c0_g1_i3.p1  ORF type:complete len:172 (+),score=14.97 TRINITY_DN2441_c0_g1_i3:268-783(+)